MWPARLRSACTSTQDGSILVYPFLDSPEAVEGTCDQQDSDQLARMYSLLCLRLSHVLL